MEQVTQDPVTLLGLRSRIRIIIVLCQQEVDEIVRIRDPKFGSHIIVCFTECIGCISKIGSRGSACIVCVEFPIVLGE